MAPKRKKSDSAPSADPNGMFSDMVVFLIETSVQPRRLQIWKQKLTQMGATISENLSKGVTHIFALNSDTLLDQISKERLARFRGSILPYQWLEDSLRSGEKVPDNIYGLRKDLDKEEKNVLEKSTHKPADGHLSSDDETSLAKRSGFHSRDSKLKETSKDHDAFYHRSNSGDSADLNRSVSPVNTPRTPDSSDKDHSSPLYNPPDLNKNITEIFGKLINIYRALGDDRRSFSYYKATPVIEKVPFKIESADQVKDLPSIGKSMQEHIQEIVTTGKLSKLEHFETDEKVCTISLFGEVWGIGPAMALKLHEKRHRSLEDLKNGESVTHSQRLGLQYFDDIKQRIPWN